MNQERPQRLAFRSQHFGVYTWSEGGKRLVEWWSSFFDHYFSRNKVLGSWGWIMSLAAALSAFGSLNGTFFSGGRVCFVAAREGHMVSHENVFGRWQ